MKACRNFCFTLSLALICVFAGHPTINAQDNSFRMDPNVTLGDTSQRHLLILLDYSKLIGFAEDIDGGELVFQLYNADNVSRFSLTEVRYLGIYGETEKERNAIGSAGPALTDFTYTRTALKPEGRGRYRNLNLLYNIAEFNLNDNVQFGTGVLVPFGFLFTQRVRFSAGEFVNFGLSNQASLILIDQFEGAFVVGDLKAIATYGTNERLLNFGIGILYATTSTETVNTISLGGGGKIGRNWHLYGEMGIFNDEFGDTVVIPTFSASYAAASHRWRFGIATILVEESFVIPLPFLGYDFNW